MVPTTRLLRAGFAGVIVVFRGARLMVWLSFFYGGLMLLNGLGHTLGSVYFGRLLPGVYSSPLLLAASIWLLVTARRKATSPL